MSSSTIRAVKGAIGSTRITSLTAAFAYCSGWLAEEPPLVRVGSEQQQRVR